MENLALGARMVRTGVVFETMRLLRLGDRPRYLADQAQRLGPTFVKLAQFASTRRDILPVEYAETFKTLQNDVECDDPDTTVANFRARTGVDPNVMFEAFDPRPVATGSIAQVHRARFNGADVAIKILKSGVEGGVRRDLAVLAWASRILPEQLKARYGTVLAQYGDTLGREMDMAEEARTMRLARRRLRDSDFDVIVPRPLAVKRSGVLVMEFVGSRGVMEAGHGGPDAAYRTASSLMEASLYLVFSGGPVNCDPHEGNLGVAADGQLVLYDHGNSFHPSPAFMEGMLLSLVAFQMRDRDALLRTMTERGFLEADPAMGASEARQLLEALLDQIFGYVRSMDIADFDVEVFRRGSVYMSSDLYSVMRALLMTEGICKALSPRFTVDGAIEGFLERYGLELALRRASGDISRTFDDGE